MIKRRQAFAYNAPGATSEYIGIGGRNMIQNGGYLPPVSQNNNYIVGQGVDYTYVPKDSFRNHFYRWYEDVIAFGDKSDDMFRIQRPWQPLFQVWYMFGFRVYIEFFDVNAIIDFVNPADDDVPIEQSIRKALAVLRTGFKAERLSNNLINIEI